MRRRSSSTPSNSDRLFSCGNSPSSSPVTNTVWNSRPFAACTVMSCSAGRPSAACVSPASSAACARNAVSGSVAPPRAAGVAVGVARRERDRRVDREIGLAQEAVGGVDELLEVVERSCAVLLGLVVRDEARRRDHVLDRLGQRQPGRRARASPRSAATNAARLLPALPPTAPAARRLPQRRALRRAPRPAASPACARRCRAAES